MRFLGFGSSFEEEVACVRSLGLWGGGKLGRVMLKVSRVLGDCSPFIGLGMGY